MKVRIRGRDFDLTELQARVIQYLHLAYKEGNSLVKQEDMKDAIFKGTVYRRKIGEVFKCNEEAMKELIAYGKNKRYIRLNIA